MSGKSNTFPSFPAVFNAMFLHTWGRVTAYKHSSFAGISFVVFLFRNRKIAGKSLLECVLSGEGKGKIASRGCDIEIMS